MRLPRPGLTQRILGVIALAMAAGGWLVIAYAETLHRDSMFEHVRKQGLVFLTGIAHDLERQPEHDRESILAEALARSLKDLDFSVTRFRLIDRRGAESAVTVRPSHHESIMAGHGGLSPGMDRLFSGESHAMGGEIREATHPESGGQAFTSTLTVPVRGGGTVRYALAMDLDLGRTMARLEIQNRNFNLRVGGIVAGAVTIVFLVVWWVAGRGLIGPVRDMSAVTDRIASGDLSPRATGRYPAELGTLARSVNAMADGIESLLKEQEAAYFETLQSLGRALQAKDHYTALHSARVAKVSVMLAGYLGLPEDKRLLLHKGALMHDLGKIGIADAILNKPGPLTPDERKAMESHPVNTATIMAPLRRFREFIEIAAWHHERWDGKGYPDGLAGEAIPLPARIVALADTWDAMTGNRVYRKGMPPEKALAIIEAERDSGQWDPVLVDAFVAMMKDAPAPDDEPSADMINVVTEFAGPAVGQTLSLPRFSRKKSGYI